MTTIVKLWDGYLQAWRDHGVFLGLLLGLIALALLAAVVLA